MQSSTVRERNNLTQGAEIRGAEESFSLELPRFAAAPGLPAARGLLQPLVEAVWPETDDALVRLRRTIAIWLCSCPFPALGPFHAPLANAGHFLRLEPSLSTMPITSTAPSQALKIILLSPESQGVFAMSSIEGQAVLMLDEQALRRAATQALSVQGGQPGPMLLVSPWELNLGAMATTTAAAGVGGEGRYLSVPSNDSSKSLTAAASFLSSSSAGLSSGTTPLAPAVSLGLDAGGERLEAQAGPMLAQPVLHAVAAAWPGNSALARLKRRAALALAAAQDGPEGPYSMLASALGDVLHRHEPDAVAELRHPVTKTLRVKQLLHEGGPGEGALPPPLGSPPLVAANIGGAAGSSTASGAGFLRVVKGKYDIVVVLDLLGLMQSHGPPGSVSLVAGPGGGPGPSAAGVAAAAAAAAAATMAGSSSMLQPSRSFGAASSASSGSLQVCGSAVQPLLAPRSSGGVLSLVSEPVAQWPGASGSRGLLAAGVSPPPGGLTSVGSGGGASTTAAATVGGGVLGLPYGTEDVGELALRAFPGSAPAAQLRRAIVVHLAGLPRRSQQWTHLGIFVASAQAHLWLNPAHRWPKLKAFVMHPDSRGVFLDVQLPGPGAAAGLVALDPAALRRASAAGLAAAITSAWPGNAPLERIRRAAAFTLAFAVRGPAGPYTMLGSALGTAIRKRDKEAFDALAGMGKLSELLDDTAASTSIHSGGGSTSASGVGPGPSGVVGESAAAATPAGSHRGSASGLGPVPAGGVPGGEQAGGSSSSAVHTGEGPPAVEAEASAVSEGGGGGGEAGPPPLQETGPMRGGTEGGAGQQVVAAQAGYIVSFKKDQDGYMRLRLDALLQDFPRDDGAAAAATAGTVLLPSAGGGLPDAAGPGGHDVPTFPSCSSSGATLPPASAPTSPQAPQSLAPQTSTSSGAALDQGLFAAGGVAAGGGLLPPHHAATAAAMAAGAAAAAGGVPDGSPPLEQELLRRFPTPPGAASNSEQATIAAAKRCIARLLAWAPPPHQLTFAKLGAQVPKLLGGARIGRNLRLVCLEEPDVFAVQSQSPTVHVVRLVCPRLLQLAHEQAERKAHAAAVAGPVPGSSLAAAPTGSPTSAPMGHPPTAIPALPQLVQVYQAAPSGAQLLPGRQQQQPSAVVLQQRHQPTVLLQTTLGSQGPHGQPQLGPAAQRAALVAGPAAQPQQAHPQGAPVAVLPLSYAAANLRLQSAHQPGELLVGAGAGVGQLTTGEQREAELTQQLQQQLQQLQLQQQQQQQPQGAQQQTIHTVQVVAGGSQPPAVWSIGWPSQAATAASAAQQQQQRPGQLGRQEQQQRQLLLLQQQQAAAAAAAAQQQQQQGPGASALKSAMSVGISGPSGAAGAGGAQQALLYDDRLTLAASAPPPSSHSSIVGSVGSAGGPEAFAAGMLDPSGMSRPLWHAASPPAAGGAGGGPQQPQHSQQPQRPQQASQQQLLHHHPHQHHHPGPGSSSAAAAAAPGTSSQGVGGLPASRLQDFVSAALVAEAALQSQSAAAAAAAAAAVVGGAGGGVSSGAATAATGPLPATSVHVLSDPYSSDFLAVLQHCHSCAQVGLAVQVYDGRPALVSLYAPSAVSGPPVGVAVGSHGLTETWTPAVYVLDCTASSAGEGPEALVGTLLASLRGLLEEPGVAKVVHGCEQVRPLEVATGASVAPLLDTRILLDAMATLLPPLPPLPSASAVAAAAAAGPLPAGGYGAVEAAAIAQLTAHVTELRGVLLSVELWADRPEMVGVLARLHFAAHRAELWAAAGRNSTWLSRPLTESQVGVAAQSVHHLPELWAALCEAVPWLAAHAALRMMQQLRALAPGTAG